MSTAILPDGSIVVRLASETVHLDVRTKAIHLRAASTRDELGGSILESFPQTAVDRVRIIRESDGVHHMFLELRSTRKLSLGSAPSHEIAMMTARVVADLTRCKIEISQGTVALPGPSESFSAGVTMDQQIGSLGFRPNAHDPFEAPTGRISLEAAKRAAHEDARASQRETAVVPREVLREVVRETALAAQALEDATVVPGASTSVTGQDEDPLELTACRPASAEEVMLQVDISGIKVPAPRAVVAADEEVDDTVFSTRVRFAREEDSWRSFEDERDPTLEDAFDMSLDSWGEMLPVIIPPRSA